MNRARRDAGWPVVACVLFVGGCTFQPDYASYPPCGGASECPVGTSCVPELGICLSDCGEGRPCLSVGILGQLPPATETSMYEHVFPTAGGIPPFHHRLTAGALPEGITLEADGALRGTPAALGIFSFEVEHSDASVPTQTVVNATQLRVRPLLRSASPGRLTDSRLSSSYREVVHATGGTPPYTFEIISPLPDGLSLDSAGVITGNPERTGQTNVTVRISDADQPPQSASGTFMLSVIAPPFGLTVLTHGLADGRAGTPYLQQLVTGGTTYAVAWSIAAGALPDGVTLSADGILSGTPTTPGASSVTLRAETSTALVDRDFTLRVY